MIKRIVVLLGRQVLVTSEDGKIVFEFDCATGDRENPTNIGHFQILRKHRTYTSKTYKVPMDFAMFFTTDGKAIHKSHAVAPISYLKWAGFDQLGSHGCVRLSDSDARALFDWTPIGTTVEIRRD